MPMLMPDLGTTAVSYEYAVRDELLTHRAELSRYFSGEYPLSVLRIGGTEYELRGTIRGHVYPKDGGFEFVVDAVPGHLTGRGNTAEEAREDWLRRVHATIQHFLSKRPFELSREETAEWRALQSVIDIAQYRRRTPVRMRQLGYVEYRKHPFPRAIRWVEGGREDVALEVMPPEFAGLKPRQWVEAICERDPLSGRLLRVTHIEPIPAVRMMTPEQQTAFFQALPASQSLPESDLDWTQPR